MLGFLGRMLRAPKPSAPPPSLPLAGGRRKVVPPRQIYDFAVAHGLLASGPSSVQPDAHQVPAHRVLSRQGEVAMLPALTLHTEPSFELHFPECLVAGGQLAIIYGDYLLPGGFYHQNTWLGGLDPMDPRPQVIALPMLPVIERPESQMAMLGFGSHWGHFFTDVLDRAWAMEDRGQWSLPMLVSVPGLCANAEALLGLCGLATDASQWVVPEKGHYLHCKQLHVHTLRSRKPAAPVESLLRLQAAVNARCTAAEATEGVLYVGRGDVSVRRVLGQDDLCEALDASGLGTAFFPEHVGIEESIRMFSHHDTVFLPMGSSKFNLVFCRPGTRVVCITPEGYAVRGGVGTLLRHMASALQLELVFYEVPSVPVPGTSGRKLLHHDLVFEMADIHSALKQIESGSLGSGRMS